MKKTKFEQISVKLDEYITKMIMSKNPEDIKYWREQYLLYLEANGWTEDEFDEAMLANINSNWVDKSKIN